MSKAKRAGSVWTIGYEQAGFPAFLEALQGDDIETLVDVRELPNSRRAGFSKNVLKASLASAGIGYVHLKALGTPKAGRLAAQAGDRTSFAKIVNAALDRPEARLAIEQAAVLIGNGRVCLMCLEHDWRVCHRAQICAILKKDFGVNAHHLAPAVAP